MACFELTLKGNINIQTMQNAGLFIGDRITTAGWNAHSKTNTLFEIGGNENLLFGNVGVLNDQDVIDTPIDDRDLHLIKEEGAQGDSHLQIRDVRVNTMTQNSSFFVGKGTVTGMDANEKDNYAMGTIYGNVNQEIRNTNLNFDEDMIDGVIHDNDIKITSIGERGDEGGK